LGASKPTLQSMHLTDFMKYVFCPGLQGVHTSVPTRWVFVIEMSKDDSNFKTYLQMKALHFLQTSQTPEFGVGSEVAALAVIVSLSCGERSLGTEDASGPGGLLSAVGSSLADCAFAGSWSYKPC